MVDSAVLSPQQNLADLINQLPDPALRQQMAQSLSALMQNVEQMSNAMAALQQEATTDKLTALPNRRAYDEKIEAEWSRAMRTQQPIALISIDVDNFKKYNDTYGHDGGDICLKEVADTLK